MNTPPFLIAVGLLFWGMQTGFFIYAVIMAVLLETSHFVKSRWEFAEKEYYRIFDLCGLLFVGGVAIATTSEDVRVPLLSLVQWFPFIFFPITAAQAYGNREKLSMRTLSWFLRRRKAGLAEKEVNISYAFLGICLLSASAVGGGRYGGDLISPLSSRTFYYVIAAILIWAFFSMRSRRVHPFIWIFLVSCTAISGYFGQLGLQELQKHVETSLMEWISQYARREANRFESETAIGRVGEIKLSGKIVLRLEPQNGTPPPTLLRELSYDSYANATWHATRKEAGELTIETNDVWKLHPDVPSKSSARISGYLHKGRGLLPLPAGTVQLGDLPVGNVKTNALGMTRVEEGPKFIRFLANSNPSASNDSPPLDDSEGGPNPDKYIPESESTVLREIVQQLDLKSPDKTLDEKLRIIHTFFQNNFSYTLFITPAHVDATRKKTPLGVFLTEVRSGHCEYFASATVLLARAADIPARYATGFAVDETSGDESMYVIRERHAHAWTLIYRPGAGGTPGIWEDFDTTPASWEETGEEKASFWQPVTDAWSRMTYEFSRWRYSKTNFRQYAIWLLIPLVAFLVWRIIYNKKRKRVSASGADPGTVWPGLDSELYEMESELAGRGLERMPTELLTKWVGRVEGAACVPPAEFKSAVDLHAQYRFDPNGLNSEERASLRASVQSCLRALRAQPPNAVQTAEVSSQVG